MVSDKITYHLFFYYAFHSLLVCLLAFGIVMPRGISLLGSTMILLGLALYIAQRHSITITQPYKWFSLVIAGPGIAAMLALISADTDYFSWHRLDQPIRYLLVLPLFYMLSTIKVNPKVLFWSCVIGSITNGSNGLLELSAKSALLAQGSAGHTIMYGCISAILAIFCLAMVPYQQSKLLKILGVTGFLFGSLAAICSGSRGAWLGLMTMFILLFPLFDRSTRYTAALLTASAIVLSALFLYFSPQPNLVSKIQDRLSSIQNDLTAYKHEENVSSSIGARLEMWRAAWLIFSEHPLLGSGPKTFYNESQALIEEGAIRDFTMEHQHAHNDILNALASTGVIGFIAFISIVAIPTLYFLKNLLYIDRRHSSHLFIKLGVLTCIGYAVFGLTETMFDRHLPIIFYLLIITICLSQSQPNTIKTHQADS